MFLCAQDGGKMQSLGYLENKNDISYFSQTPQIDNREARKTANCVTPK